MHTHHSHLGARKRCACYIWDLRHPWIHVPSPLVVLLSFRLYEVRAFTLSLSLWVGIVRLDNQRPCSWNESFVALYWVGSSYLNIQFGRRRKFLKCFVVNGTYILFGYWTCLRNFVPRFCDCVSQFLCCWKMFSTCKSCLIGTVFLALFAHTSCGHMYSTYIRFLDQMYFSA